MWNFTQTLIWRHVLKIQTCSTAWLPGVGDRGRCVWLCRRFGLWPLPPPLGSSLGQTTDSPALLQIPTVNKCFYFSYIAKKLPRIIDKSKFGPVFIYVKEQLLLYRYIWISKTVVQYSVEFKAYKQERCHRKLVLSHKYHGKILIRQSNKLIVFFP